MVREVVCVLGLTVGGMLSAEVMVAAALCMQKIYCFAHYGIHVRTVQVPREEE